MNKQTEKAREQEVWLGLNKRRRVSYIYLEGRRLRREARKQGTIGSCVTVEQSVSRCLVRTFWLSYFWRKKKIFKIFFEIQHVRPVQRESLEMQSSSFLILVPFIFIFLHASSSCSSSFFFSSSSSSPVLFIFCLLSRPSLSLSHPMLFRCLRYSRETSSIFSCPTSHLCFLSRSSCCSSPPFLCFRIRASSTSFSFHTKLHSLCCPRCFPFLAINFSIFSVSIIPLHRLRRFFNLRFRFLLRLQPSSIELNPHRIGRRKKELRKSAELSWEQWEPSL